MARGSKKKDTSKQKRKAHDIEKGYKKRGVSSKEAERRAWATVNKSDKGGRKKGGGGRGKKRSKSSSRKGGRKGGRGRAAQSTSDRVRDDAPTDGDKIAAKVQGNFILIWPVSFVQPWLPLYGEPFAFFLADAQSFSFAVQLGPLSQCSASQRLVFELSQYHVTGSAR